MKKIIIVLLTVCTLLMIYMFILINNNNGLEKEKQVFIHNIYVTVCAELSNPFMEPIHKPSISNITEYINSLNKTLSVAKLDTKSRDIPPDEKINGEYILSFDFYLTKHITKLEKIRDKLIKGKALTEKDIRTYEDIYSRFHRLEKEMRASKKDVISDGDIKEVYINHLSQFND